MPAVPPEIAADLLVRSRGVAIILAMSSILNVPRRIPFVFITGSREMLYLLILEIASASEVFSSITIAPDMTSSTLACPKSAVDTRSVSLTMPTSSPFSTTGMARFPLPITSWAAFSMS